MGEVTHHVASRHADRDAEEAQGLLADRPMYPELHGMRRWLKGCLAAQMFMAAIGVCAMVSLSFLGGSHAADGRVGGSDRAMVSLRADDQGSAHARSLTANYVRLRMANDIAGVQNMFAPNGKMYIDLSHANWMVAMKVKAKCGTEFTGPKDVARFYEVFPAQPNDPVLDPAEFRCAPHLCTVFDTVRRFPVGKIKTQADFEWNAENKIESLILILS